MERKMTTDVLVVGAGPSGVPAAIAAARHGVKVILVEEDSLAGGAPVDMYVCMTCGGPRVGIYAEMLDILNDRHTLDRHPIHPFDSGNDGCNHWWMPYAYADTVAGMLAGEPNITLITGVRAEALLLRTDENGRTVVEGACCFCGFGTEHLEIRANITVDATGTGVLGEMAGCDVRFGGDSRADFDEEYAPLERSKTLMPCTLQYITQRLGGTSMPKQEEFSKTALRSGFVEDKLHMWSSALYEEAIRRNVGIYLHWGATVSCPDTRDAMILGEAHRQALAMIQENAALWYRYGFTVSVAPKIGVRECRRVMGEAVLTIYDMLGGTFPQDTVAVSEYGVDLWGAAKVDEDKLNREFKPYGIPYGALIPRGTEGLLMAGKSISGSRFACSSYRVQPIVAAIGQAAGTAAALAVSRRVPLRQVPVTALQQLLQQDHALCL